MLDTSINKQRIVKRSAQTVDSLKGTFQSNHKIELQMEIILVRIFSFLFAENSVLLQKLKMFLKETTMKCFA